MNQITQQDRLQYIDTARAIGIFCVIWGHHIQNPVFHYVYSFHIPLFFFISGVVFNCKRESSFATFTRKKIHRLVLPYFIFAAILFLKWLSLGWLSGGITSCERVIKNVIGIFYAQGGPKYMEWGIPMWFLPCLFLMNEFYWLFEKLQLGALINTIVFLLLTIFGIYLFKFKFALPWSIDIAFIGLFYFHLGAIYNSKESPGLLKIEEHLLIPFFLISIFLAFSNGRLDLYYHEAGKVMILIPASLFGIYTVIIASRSLKPTSLTRLINRYAIPLLAFHTIIGGLIKKSLAFVFGGFSNDVFSSFLISIVQIMIIVYICEFWVKARRALIRRKPSKGILSEIEEKQH